MGTKPADSDIEAYEYASTHIDQNDLNGEFIRLSGDLAYWNAQYAEAYRIWLQAKADHDRESASCYMQHRSRVDAKGKSLSVDDAKSKAAYDDEVEDVRKQLVEAEADKVRLRGVVEAIVAKKDMLQSLGAKIRAELQGDPSLRAFHSEDGLSAGH